MASFTSELLICDMFTVGLELEAAESPDGALAVLEDDVVSVELDGVDAPLIEPDVDVAGVVEDAPALDPTELGAAAVVLVEVDGVLAVPVVPPDVGVDVALLSFTRVAEAVWSLRELWKYFDTLEMNVCAAGGGGTFPVRSCLNGIMRPYSSRVLSSSCFTTAPFSVMPAKAPRAREYVRISERIFQSVLPSAWRPTGPAAAEASAPTLNLLFNSCVMPCWFITSITRSIACPPICKPQLPPSTTNGAGALHWPLLRQVATPRP